MMKGEKNMKYYIVYYKTSRARINGVYYEEEGFYHQKVREDKLENFKKRHNVVEIKEFTKQI